MPHPSLRIRAAAVLALALPCAPAAAADFAVDPAHTAIHFAVSHFDISYVRGRFTKVRGTIAFDPERKTGTVDLRIDPDSLDTGNATLDAVLRSEQFLGTAQSGEARFSVAAFVFDGERLAAVDGTLVLRGIARPVRLTATRFVCKDVRAGIATRHVCGGEFRTTLRRTDFGMTRFLSDVGDEVDLAIDIEATRQ
jgi:polyisoprenoid-binding protein YceI